MLLLDVQVEIDRSKDDLLNEWYYAHVPRLVSVPGYDSGRRYVALTPGPRYLALYEIRDESYLASLLGGDQSLRNPLTLSEWGRWDKDLVPHMSHCRTNLYRPPDEGTLPLLRSAKAIVTVRLDAGREKNAVLAAATNRLISAESEVTATRLLQAAEGYPSTDWLSTSPDTLLILECTGPRTARAMARGDGAAGAFMRDLSANIGVPTMTAYRTIAEHWPLENME